MNFFFFQSRLRSRQGSTPLPPHHCPISGECYDVRSNHCSQEACERTTRAPTTPATIVSPNMAHDCTQVHYNCKKPGVFVNPLDASVWFECTKTKMNSWDQRCRECPKFTCFDIKSRACVINCMKINESLFLRCKHKWTRKCETLRSIG